MAENKQSFVAYCNWGDTFDELSDEEAGKLIKHLFNYVRDKNPESDKLTKLLFIPIQNTLKRDLKKYEGYIEKQKENGKKGGRPSKPKKPNPLFKNPTEPKKADSVSVSVSDNVNDIYKRINIENSHSWIESIARTNKFNVNQVKNSLDRFLNEIELKCWEGDERECKAYFINWINLNPPERYQPPADREPLYD